MPLLGCQIKPKRVDEGGRMRILLVFVMLLSGCAAGPGFATSLAAVLGGQQSGGYAYQPVPAYYEPWPEAQSQSGYRPQMMTCSQMGSFTRCTAW